MTSSLDLGAEVFGRDLRRVLGGQHDGLDRRRRRAVVADGHLGLAVGAEVVDLARAAHLGEPLGEPVREPDRQRHELGGLAGGVAEHDALVAGALPVERVAARCPRASRRRRRRPGRCRATARRSRRDAARAAVEPDVGRVVADAVTARARSRGSRRSRGRDLAGDVHEAGGDERLDRDARVRVVGEERVEDGVGDLVADLVGVSLGDGLGGEQAKGSCEICSVGSAARSE